jgi:hypothetical protein
VPDQRRADDGPGRGQPQVEQSVHEDPQEDQHLHADEREVGPPPPARAPRAAQEAVGQHRPQHVEQQQHRHDREDETHVAEW